MSGLKALARIYQPPKSAMQSGRGRSGGWLLQFAPGEAQRPDPLMGWAGSGDTESQVRLHFDTKKEAIAYAQARNLSYEVELPRPPKAIKPKVYADNFKFGRTENWTH